MGFIIFSRYYCILITFVTLSYFLSLIPLILSFHMDVYVHIYAMKYITYVLKFTFSYERSCVVFSHYPIVSSILTVPFLLSCHTTIHTHVCLEFNLELHIEKTFINLTNFTKYVGLHIYSFSYEYNKFIFFMDAKTPLFYIFSLAYIC